MRELPTTFSLPQRVLHWAMVGLILFNLLLPQGMGGRGLDIGVVPPAFVHVMVGSAVLVLGLLRLLLRLIDGVPPEPCGAPLVFCRLARFGQWVFYALFFAMPLSGLIGLYGGSAAALMLHGQVLRWLWWLLIAGHVSLALAHQFLWKTDMLGKMLRG